VTVARPLQKTITEWDEYTGRFAAVEHVEIRARVSGFIDTVNFNEGQLVKQGDPLFVIDPRPYKLAVEQAQADLERARAKLQIASLDVQRAAPLVRSQTVTEREFDTCRATERDAAGQVGGRGALKAGAQPRMDRGPAHRSPAHLGPARRSRQPITGGPSGATLLTTIVPSTRSTCVRRQRGRLPAISGSRRRGRPSSRDVQNPAVRLATRPNSP
jgi:multidrug efflux pump subunit AcrA (membrane-fusion protein)